MASLAEIKRIAANDPAVEEVNWSVKDLSDADVDGLAAALAGNRHVTELTKKFKIERLDEENLGVPKFEVMAKLHWDEGRLQKLLQDR